MTQEFRELTDLNDYKIEIDDKWVQIEDTDGCFSGYCHQSQNQKYIVVFSSPYEMDDEIGKVTVIPGRVYLIENNSKILWKKETDKPLKYFVTDDASVIIFSSKEYSVFDAEGKELYHYKFNSNILGIEFSEKYSILIVTTFDPDNKIYCFDIYGYKLIWIKDNLLPSSIRVIRFLDNSTICLSIDNSQEDSYCIDLNGNLIEGSIKESAINKRRRLKSTAESKFNQKQYAEAELLFLQAYMITDEYLFSWNDIPGKDTDKFLEIIRSIFGIDRIKISKIEKIDDGKTLIIVTDRNNFSLSFNNDKTKAILKIDDGRTHEFIAKKENEKLNIYKNIVSYESENEGLCKRIAETKYKLEKYIEALEYWEKAIYLSENFLRSVNASETDIKYFNQNIEKNVFRTYRKLILLYKKQGKNDLAENIIQQFLNKYPNQSNEVLPKLRSQKNKEESFLIDSINNSVSLKLIKKIKIKSKAKHCIVKFIDNQLLYRFGTQEAYTLIKISNTADTDWDTHYEMEKALSNFKIGSYSQYLTFSSNFIAVWSNAVESDVFKLRVFNNAGEFLWDYDVKQRLKAISVSDTGMVLYAIVDCAYLISDSKDKKELLKWKCPKKPIKEDTEEMDDSDKIYSDGMISIFAKVYAEPFNDIRSLKISPDSRYIFLGCYSGDLFCLNLNKQIIWHLKISSSQIDGIFSSDNGDNLVISSRDGHIYFIEKGKILNKYKVTNRWILAEYHNIKQQFFISDGKEFSIFDKNGTLLSKIIFKNDVNWFDISEKLNAIAIASDGIDIFSI